MASDLSTVKSVIRRSSPLASAQRPHLAASNLRDSASYLLQQRSGAVAIAPGLYLGLFEFLLLHSDDGPNIFAIFCSSPAKLPDDHVLGSRKKHVAPIYSNGSPSAKSLLIMRGVRQPKHLHFKKSAFNQKLLPLSTCIRLERDLRVRLEVGPKRLCE